MYTRLLPTHPMSQRSEHLIPFSTSPISPSPSALASTVSESSDGILSRPSTPSLRLEEWLSKRSKHSRPPVHLRIPSPDFVYENKGLERNFNLPTSHQTVHIQTPEIFNNAISKEDQQINSRKNDDLWDSFLKRFSKIPEEKEVEEDMIIDDKDTNNSTLICYTDIPWIGTIDNTSSSFSQQVLFLNREDIGIPHSVYFLDQDKDVERGLIKERFRILLLRWHSDKFMQSFQNLLNPKDEEQIKQRLNSTTSRLYEIRDEMLGVSSGNGKS